MRAWELYENENDIEGRRNMMRRDPVKDGAYTIYRACHISVNEFNEMDYVTPSKKFAIEHAEHMTITEEEPYHVIRAIVINNRNDTVLYHAPNTGELFYDGPSKKGKEIYKTGSELNEDFGVPTPSVEEIAKKHGVSVEFINQQLDVGMRIEREHSLYDTIRSEISRDHLAEIPDYYTRLLKMERDAK